MCDGLYLISVRFYSFCLWQCLPPLFSSLSPRPHTLSLSSPPCPVLLTHTMQLLMCGMEKVSFDDLKQNCVINQGRRSNARFQEVLSWFWTIVSSFTQEEIARLLQFVTGCSQLPPGGFKKLEPRFTITPAPTRGRLPTAHTWYICYSVNIIVHNICTYFRSYMLSKFGKCM